MDHPFRAKLEAMDYTEIRVDANDNCPMMAQQVYRNTGDPRRITRVRIYEGEPEGVLYAVTGWSAEGPVDAWAVSIEDSSAGSAFLVYGGDWGLRLRPATSEAAWDLGAANQFGETHLVLADAEDLI
jgi:hypothetical protein